MQHKTKQNINYLTQVPYKKVAESKEEEGSITLLIPKFRNAWFRKWLIPKQRSSSFRIHLDIIGSQVWRSIDGKNQVQTICNELSQYLINQNRPVNRIEERVTVFMTDLAKKGFIGFNEAQLQSNE